MEDLNDKVTGGNLTAAQWNQVPSEIQNVIEGLGQVLSVGDLNQLGKGIAGYVANGQFYTDSGAANAYVCSVVGLKQAPTAYTNGMAVEFVPANTNTGSSTVNVASLGVKNISNTSTGGEILAGTRISLRYNTGTGEFDIFQTAAVPVTSGQIYGLTMSNNAIDALNDIDIAIGEAADSTNTYLMVLSAVMTKQLDAAWAVGTNAGGLFSGTKAVNTWYHVFLIRKDSDGTIDAGFDTSVTAANIPAGYSAYRRIGSILTDATPNILGFIQVGDNFTWKLAAAEFSGNFPTTATLLTLSVPPGVRCIANLSIFATYGSNTANVYAYYRLYATDALAGAATNINNDICFNGDSGYHNVNSSFVRIPTDTNSQVYHHGTNAVVGLFVDTKSYDDLRGK